MTELKRVDLTEHRDSNVAIFSNWDSKYDDLAKISMPNFAEYCNKHHYFLRGYLNYHEDPSQPETFGDKGKLQCYIDLRGHFEYVMFLDVDSLFVNMDIKVEDLMDVCRNFFWTFDSNGPLSGMWIAKTDDKTESHLRHAYERAAIENNVRHGKIEPNGISDQDSMRDLMNIPPFRDTFGPQNCWPAEQWQAYETNYAPGAWVITWPGMPVEEKMKRMLAWKEKYNV